MKKTVLIGISGGIAAVKLPLLLAALTDKNISVDVIETKNATHILPPATISHITGKAVYTTMYPDDFAATPLLKKRHVEHIDLADRAKVFVIAPATANVIAKLAHGIADDYLTTVALAVSCPVLICPSMNPNMWHHPVTQQNIHTLKSLGYHIMPPARGPLACGYEGEGRMPDVEIIQQEIERILNTTHRMQGKNVIVTTGGTTEPIDRVRTISNRSSGKMGMAIAEACFLSGARVRILRSSTSVVSRYTMDEHLFETADELEQLLQTYVPQADIVFHVAAVSDFSVKTSLNGKYSSKAPLPLELEPRTKILDTIKNMNPSVYVIAFKAEFGMTNAMLSKTARERLKESGADVIIANDIGREGIGFQSNENEVIFIPKNGKSVVLEKATKTEIASQIVDMLSSFME